MNIGGMNEDHSAVGETIHLLPLYHFSKESISLLSENATCPQRCHFLQIAGYDNFHWA